MPWSTFFTYIAQSAIVLLFVFIASAVIAAIYGGFKDK